MIKHSSKKNSGIFDECGEQKHNSVHRCKLDTMKKNKMLQSDVILTWNEQFENVLENIKKENISSFLEVVGLVKAF